MAFSTRNGRIEYDSDGNLHMLVGRYNQRDVPARGCLAAPFGDSLVFLAQTKKTNEDHYWVSLRQDECSYTCDWGGASGSSIWIGGSTSTYTNRDPGYPDAYDLDGNVIARPQRDGVDESDGGRLDPYPETPFAASTGDVDPFPQEMLDRIDGSTFRGQIDISPNFGVVPDVICSSGTFGIPIDVFHPCAQFFDMNFGVRIENQITGEVTDRNFTLENAVDTVDIELDVPSSFPTGITRFADLSFSGEFGFSGSESITTTFDIPDVSVSSIRAPNNACIGTKNAVTALVDNVSNCLANIRARLENNTTGDVQTVAETRLDANRSSEIEFDIEPTSDVFDLGSLNYTFVLERENSDGNFEDVSSRDFGVNLIKPSANIVG